MANRTRLGNRARFLLPGRSTAKVGRSGIAGYIQQGAGLLTLEHAFYIMIYRVCNGHEEHAR